MNLKACDKYNFSRTWKGRINLVCKANCPLRTCFRVNQKEEHLCKRYNIFRRKYVMEKNLKLEEKFIENLDGEDTFDSKGDDISNEEFKENEIFWECL